MKRFRLCRLRQEQTDRHVLVLPDGLSPPGSLHISLPASSFRVAAPLNVSTWSVSATTLGAGRRPSQGHVRPADHEWLCRKAICSILDLKRPCPQLHEHVRDAVSDCEKMGTVCGAPLTTRGQVTGRPGVHPLALLRSARCPARSSDPAQPGGPIHRLPPARSLLARQGPGIVLVMSSWKIYSFGIRLHNPFRHARPQCKPSL